MTTLDTTDLERLSALCHDLDQIDREIAQRNATRESIRAAISIILERLGGRVTMSGYGRLEITAPAIITSYDRALIEQLLTTLHRTHLDVAVLLEGCRKTTARSGGLRITPDR